MSDFPETRISLLLRIRDADDQDAWQDFTEVYQPVIHRLAKKRGFQDADAHDITQDVLVKISSRIREFEPGNGQARFRTWLTAVCRNALIDAFRKCGSGGVTGLEHVSQLHQQDVSVDDIEWEHRRAVFRQAARDVSVDVERTTWQAFWMTAVEGQPAKQVAADLNMRVGSVYTARCRVLQRIKDKVAEYE